MDVAQGLPPETAERGRGRIPRPHRRARRLAGIAVVVAAGALGLSACGSSPAPGAAGAPSSTHGAQTTKAATHESVTIQNFAFHPATFTVKPGATITITNEDSVTHTFTADGGAFNTGDIAPGKTATVTAPKKPGTYPYRCNIHQFMTGTLTVK